MQVRISESSDGFSDTSKGTFDNSVTKIEGAWKDESEELKPCWMKQDLGISHCFCCIY